MLAVAAGSGLLMGSAGATVGPAADSSGGIFFYGDVGNPVNSPYAKNPLLVRPTKLFLAEDGSVALLGLRWRGWGSNLARASGVLSATNCTPNCATGKRTATPAQFTLSQPKRLLGHSVYSCFQLTVPSHPQSNMHDCLERTGKLIAYRALSRPAPAVSSKTYSRFYTPSRNISCELSDRGGSRASVVCDMQKPPAIASLGAGGSVTICQHQGLKCTGNLGYYPGMPPPHQLSYGTSAKLGRFRCTSALAGLTCAVTATGKGFFISRQSVKRVG